MNTNPWFSLDDFNNEFKPKLYNTRRWDGYSTIATHLFGNQSIEIIEIGCMRTVDGWESDGQSTRVWDWMASNTKHSIVMSVDISKDAISLAMENTKKVTCIVEEGTEFLKQADVSRLNILFLDAMDFAEPHAVKSWVQHLNMLMACWSRLPKGCWIVVDDCVNRNDGKHVLINALMEGLSIKPVLESYMTIWEKP